MADVQPIGDFEPAPAEQGRLSDPDAKWDDTKGHHQSIPARPRSQSRSGWLDLEAEARRELKRKYEGKSYGERA